MSSDAGVGALREENTDEENVKKKFEQYMELREKNLRKCHFSYRRKI
jgi:hypothetical protein